MCTHECQSNEPQNAGCSSCGTAVSGAGLTWCIEAGYS